MIDQMLKQIYRSIDRFLYSESDVKTAETAHANNPVAINFLVNGFI